MKYKLRNEEQYPLYQRQYYNNLSGKVLEMYKKFIGLRAFEDKPSYPNSKTKVCVTCGIRATQEALFDVGDGIILVEKYCDLCVKNMKYQH
jgi:hypothetical protein